MSDPMPPSELAAMVDRLAPQITPGGWVASDPHGDGSYYEILGRDPGLPTFPILGEFNEQDDAEAVALVPDLMAENQRVRRELEALRDEFRFVHHRRRAHEHITRILEGES